jgi:hypothetical protein
MPHVAKTLLLLLFLAAASRGHAQSADSSASQSAAPARDAWIDRLHQGTYNFIWRSAMRIDHLFGAQYGAEAYQRGVSGSIAPIVLWDEFNGFTPKMRFNVNVPLPQLNDRFNLFIGRVNREELVTERGEQSSAFRRQVGQARDEQTIFGLSYRAPPKQGWRFDAGAGVRVGLPLNPYVKGSSI